MGDTILLFSHIPNIFSVNILSKAGGKPPPLYYFINCLSNFLSNIEVKISINSLIFDSFLELAPASLQLEPSVFSK